MLWQRSPVRRGGVATVRSRKVQPPSTVVVCPLGNPNSTSLPLDDAGRKRTETRWRNRSCDYRWRAPCWFALAAVMVIVLALMPPPFVTALQQACTADQDCAASNPTAKCIGGRCVADAKDCPAAGSACDRGYTCVASKCILDMDGSSGATYKNCVPGKNLTEAPTCPQGQTCERGFCSQQGRAAVTGYFNAADLQAKLDALSAPPIPTNTDDSPSNTPRPSACDAMLGVFLATGGRYWTPVNGTYLTINDLADKACCFTATSAHGIKCLRKTDQGPVTDARGGGNNAAANNSSALNPDVNLPVNEAAASAQQGAQQASDFSQFQGFPPQIQEVRLNGRNLTGAIPRNLWTRMSLSLTAIYLGGNPKLDFRDGTLETLGSLRTIHLSGGVNLGGDTFPSWIVNTAPNPSMLYVYMAGSGYRGVLPSAATQVLALDVSNNPDLRGYLDRAADGIFLKTLGSQVCVAPFTYPVGSTRDPLDSTSAPAGAADGTIQSQFPTSGLLSQNIDVGAGTSQTVKCSSSVVLANEWPLFVSLILAFLAYGAGALYWRDSASASPLTLLSLVSLAVEPNFLAFLIASLQQQGSGGGSGGTAAAAVTPSDGATFSDSSSSGTSTAIHNLLKLLMVVSMLVPRLANSYYTRMRTVPARVRLLATLDVWHFVADFCRRAGAKSPQRGYIPPHLRTLAALQAFVKEGAQMALASWAGATNPGAALRPTDPGPAAGWKLPVILMLAVAVTGLVKEIAFRIIWHIRGGTGMVDAEWPRPPVPSRGRRSPGRRSRRRDRTRDRTASNNRHSSTSESADAPAVAAAAEADEPQPAARQGAPLPSAYLYEMGQLHRNEGSGSSSMPRPPGPAHNPLSILVPGASRRPSAQMQAPLPRPQSSS